MSEFVSVLTLGKFCLKSRTETYTEKKIMRISNFVWRIARNKVHDNICTV